MLTLGANPPDTIVDVLLDAEGTPVNDVNARSKVLDRQTSAQAGLVPGTTYRIAVQVKNSELASDASNKTAPKLMKCYAGEIASQPVTADTTQVTCLSCGAGKILDAAARQCAPATRRQQDAVADGAFDATNSSYVAVAPEASRSTDRRSRRRPPWTAAVVGCGRAQEVAPTDQGPGQGGVRLGSLSWGVVVVLKRRCIAPADGQGGARLGPLLGCSACGCAFAGTAPAATSAW